MPSNPITDVTATTSDYLHQGNWRYLILALFWALLLASFAIALQIPSVFGKPLLSSQPDRSQIAW
jgi:hypothetical protein